MISYLNSSISLIYTNSGNTVVSASLTVLCELLKIIIIFVICKTCFSVEYLTAATYLRLKRIKYHFLLQ